MNTIWQEELFEDHKTGKYLRYLSHTAAGEGRNPLLLQIHGAGSRQSITPGTQRSRRMSCGTGYSSRQRHIIDQYERATRGLPFYLAYSSILRNTLHTLACSRILSISSSNCFLVI